jgi:hypothetical protein
MLLLLITKLLNWLRGHSATESGHAVGREVIDYVTLLHSHLIQSIEINTPTLVVFSLFSTTREILKKFTPE